MGVHKLEDLPVDTAAPAIAASRSRGRPCGDGINDTPTLIAVANLLVVQPKLTRSSAMKQVVKGIEESHLRRLHVKWKRDGNKLLAEARRRKDQELLARQAADLVKAARGFSNLLNVEMPRLLAPLASNIGRMAAHPEVKAMHSAFAGVSARVMEELSPIRTQMQRLAESGALDGLRAVPRLSGPPADLTDEERVALSRRISVTRQDQEE